MTEHFAMFLTLKRTAGSNMTVYLHYQLKATVGSLSSSYVSLYNSKFVYDFVYTLFPYVEEIFRENLRGFEESRLILYDVV
jgi:hypothetical protein